MKEREAYEKLCERIKQPGNRERYQKLYELENKEEKELHRIYWIIETVIPNLLKDIDSTDKIMDNERDNEMIKEARIRECISNIGRVNKYLDENGWK